MKFNRNEIVGYRIPSLKELKNITNEFEYVCEFSGTPIKKTFKEGDSKMGIIIYWRLECIKFPVYKKRNLY